jgi:hypothetical protein
MAFTLSAASLSKLVLAHDSPKADPEWLSETYAAKSEETLSQGLRWYYCAGLAISLLSMGIISMSHESKLIEGQRLSKLKRTLYRSIVSIAILLLPLAKERLSSLQLVGTTTALVWSVVFVDLAGLTRPHEAFWGFNEKRDCGYSANCEISKKEWRERLKNAEGGKLNVEELGMRGRGGEDRNVVDIVV